MTHILSQTQYTTLVTNIAIKTSDKSLTATDLIFYNIARGKDSMCGFTPVTNPQKLAGGNAKWFGYDSAASNLRYILKHHPGNIKALIGEPLDTDQLTAISALIGKSNGH